ENATINKWGTDEAMLKDIITSGRLTDEQLVQVIDAFYDKNSPKSLRHVVMDETSGKLEKSLLKKLTEAETNVLDSKYGQMKANGTMPLSDAQVLEATSRMYDVMKGWGTTGKGNTEIMKVLDKYKDDPNAIIQIMGAYKEKYDVELMRRFQQDFSGKQENEITNILHKALVGGSSPVNSGDET
ncbi:putative annexin, partial [Candidatus Gastranaerophilus sp. (ex Termes propinquus)]